MNTRPITAQDVINAIGGDAITSPDLVARIDADRGREVMHLLIDLVHDHTLVSIDRDGSILYCRPESA